MNELLTSGYWNQSSQTEFILVLHPHSVVRRTNKIKLRGSNLIEINIL